MFRLLFIAFYISFAFVAAGCSYCTMMLQTHEGEGGRKYHLMLVEGLLKKRKERQRLRTLLRALTTVRHTICLEETVLLTWCRKPHIEISIERTKIIDLFIAIIRFFHTHFPPVLWAGKGREKTSIFQFAVNLFALAFMLDACYIKLVCFGFPRVETQKAGNHYGNKPSRKREQLNRGRKSRGKGSWTNKYFVRLSSLLLSIKIRLFHETISHRFSMSFRKLKLRYAIKRELEN